VGLQRTWDLRGYTADGLALLSGRTRAYGFRYTEAFLSQIARADGAERFTDALACWTTHLWHPLAEKCEISFIRRNERSFCSLKTGTWWNC
jgi:hypothetical protein